MSRRQLAAVSPWAPRRLVLCAAVLGFLGAGAGSARADTRVFSSTGAEQTFTVPPGVTTLRVVATGGKAGRGGANATGGAGGLGAVATADLAVTPGEVLYVEVAGNGADSNNSLGTSGTGGFNGGSFGGYGGAPGQDGGGGGGASDVRTLPASDPSSLPSRVVIAGGGGGGGGGGADGGAGATPSVAAGDGSGFDGGGGGGSGTATMGGAGGTTSSMLSVGDGSLATGGHGGYGDFECGSGGGGGGGLYGGGGGGGAGGGSGCASTGGGGGGGAGSSGFGAGVPSSSVATDVSGTPSIVFTYALPTNRLTVLIAPGSGSGTVTGQGISCPGTCSSTYPPGTSVRLTASPSSGSRLAGWSGAGCQGTGACTVTLNSDQSVAAAFARRVVPSPNTALATVVIGLHQASFKFRGAGAATRFQCALVRAPRKKGKHHKAPKPSFSKCASPRTYRKLKPGSYTFYVRAVGPGGTDATPARHRFKIS